MPRRPWRVQDTMNSERKVLLLGCLSSLALAQSQLCCDFNADWSDSGSSSQEGAEDAFMFFTQQSSNQFAQFGLLASAAEPFARRGTRFTVGAERYSFARVQAQWADTTTCVRGHVPLQTAGSAAPLLRAAIPSPVCDSQRNCIGRRSVPVHVAPALVSCHTDDPRVGVRPLSRCSE